MMTKILCWNFEKSFLKWEKMASRKVFRHFLRTNFFTFILLISNHTVFLVQFGGNLHLRVFQKVEITLAEAARAISAFWKTHSCKLIPNWTRNRMITFTKRAELLLIEWSTLYMLNQHFSYIDLSDAKGVARVRKSLKWNFILTTSSCCYFEMNERFQLLFPHNCFDHPELLFPNCSWLNWYARCIFNFLGLKNRLFPLKYPKLATLQNIIIRYLVNTSVIHACERKFPRPTGQQSAKKTRKPHFSV